MIKIGCSKVQNQLVKNNQDSMLILRLIKLGLDFLTHQLCNFTHLVFRYPVLGTSIVTSLPCEKHDGHFV